MGLKKQVGKYRTSLSIEEVSELVTTIDVAYPQGLSSNQLVLYGIYRKLKSQLVLSSEGLIQPDYITKPRADLETRLGFVNIDTDPAQQAPVRRIKTQEEIDAELAAFDEEAFFNKVKANELKD